MRLIYNAISILQSDSLGINNRIGINYNKLSGSKCICNKTDLDVYGRFLMKKYNNDSFKTAIDNKQKVITSLENFKSKYDAKMVDKFNKAKNDLEGLKNKKGIDIITLKRDTEKIKKDIKDVNSQFEECKKEYEFITKDSKCKIIDFNNDNFVKTETAYTEVNKVYSDVTTVISNREVDGKKKKDEEEAEKLKQKQNEEAAKLAEQMKKDEEAAKLAEQKKKDEEVKKEPDEKPNADASNSQSNEKKSGCCSCCQGNCCKKDK